MAVAGIGNTLAEANLNLDQGSGTPATWYFGLLTTMPTDGDATSLVEAAWTGYSRPSLTNNTSNFPNATVVSHIAQITCQGAINWGTLPGGASPQTVYGLAECTSSSAAYSGSNMGRTAVFGTLASPVSYTLNAGASLSIAAGNLVFQET
jgi:hypothetical protein